jgi:hypothetical protein
MIDIVSNVVVRDYIQHWWQVALDIVNLNADGKNRYEIRWEAEEMVMDAIDRTIESCRFEDFHGPYDTIETRLYRLISLLYNSDGDWVNIFTKFKKIATYLEDKYTRRLNELIDQNNAS